MKLSKDDEGSAIVEFVVLALPLFVPIILYFGVIHENSSINSDLHNLARQSARAFITSPDDANEFSRMQSLVQVFVQRVFIPHGINEVPTIAVECAATPCLTPDARVKVTASITRSHQSLGGFLRFIPILQSYFSASDIQIVDAWR